MAHYDLIDENDTLLGTTATYEEIHSKGLWHRGVHVILYTSAKDVVIQKRSAGVALYPNLFEISVGGGVNAGEEPPRAAIREVYEELGFVIDPPSLVFAGTYHSNDTVGDFINRSVDRCYKVEIPEHIAFSLDTNETLSAQLVSLEELRQAIENGGEGSFGTLAERNDLWKLLLDSVED